MSETKADFDSGTDIMRKRRIESKEVSCFKKQKCGVDSSTMKCSETKSMEKSEQSEGKTEEDSLVDRKCYQENEQHKHNRRENEPTQVIVTKNEYHKEKKKKHKHKKSDHISSREPNTSDQKQAEHRHQSGESRTVPARKRTESADDHCPDMAREHQHVIEERGLVRGINQTGECTPQKKRKKKKKKHKHKKEQPDKHECNSSQFTKSSEAKHSLQEGEHVYGEFKLAGATNKREDDHIPENRRQHERHEQSRDDCKPPQAAKEENPEKAAKSEQPEENRYSRYERKPVDSKTRLDAFIREKIRCLTENKELKPRQSDHDGYHSTRKNEEKKDSTLHHQEHYDRETSGFPVAKKPKLSNKKRNSRLVNASLFGNKTSSVSGLQRRSVHDQQKIQDSKDDYEYFYGNKSEFSQHFPCVFQINNKTFNCAEQYMMYKKAVTFKDKDAEEKILNAKDPVLQKRLGRAVRNFDGRVWDRVCENVVLEANYAKFTQNTSLLTTLKGTYPRTLVEASGRDRKWGIGLGKNNPKAWTKATWRGQNKLGYILTTLRNNLTATS